MRRPALAFVGLGLLLIAADDRPSATAGKESLAPLQQLVGEWKGVGQPKRGSTAGSWVEQANWAWQFSDAGAAIVFDAEGGKLFRAGRIVPGDEPGAFVLIGTLPEGEAEERLHGRLNENDQLVLEADEPAEGRPARITVRTVADGDRLLVLYEARRGTGTFVRLAEVGYTRQGSNFGQGGNGPECVVTGGYGSIAVAYEGRTYYVCCTGCKDLFDSDPAGVLADYKARKEAERAEREAE
jgi:hypothetical protein